MRVTQPWLELPNDKERDAIKKAFDWEMEFNSSIKYHQRTVEDSQNGFCGGGIYQVEEGKGPSMIVYFRVNDVDEKAKSVIEAGGAIIEGPFDVPNLGRLCIFQDPTGQHFGMIKRIWE